MYQNIVKAPPRDPSGRVPVRCYHEDPARITERLVMQHAGDDPRDILEMLGLLEGPA